MKDLRNIVNQDPIEYAFHCFFEGKEMRRNSGWSPAKNPSWIMPEDWLSRYHIYFDHFGHLLEDKDVLDLGANLNFYGAWALKNGARSLRYIEPDERRFEMGIQYLKYRSLHERTFGEEIDLNRYMSTEFDQIPIVFLLDVLYYTDNHVQILKYIKNVVKPEHVFFECTVVDDVETSPEGILEAWRPSPDPEIFQTFQNRRFPTPKIAFTPSRKALFSMFDAVGFEIEAMYDYKDYTGTGESKVRLNGQKVFMLLK